MRSSHLKTLLIATSIWAVTPLSAIAGSTFPTSVIFTAAASVTRPADVVQLQGVALAATIAPSSAIVVESTGTPAKAYNLAFELSNAGSSNIVDMYENGGSQTWSINVSKATISQFLFNSSYASTSTGRFGVSRSPSGINGGVNGTLGTGTSNTAGTMDRGYLGSAAAGTQFLNGTISRIAFYNRALTPAQLQARTRLGAPF